MKIGGQEADGSKRRLRSLRDVEALGGLTRKESRPQRMSANGRWKCHGAGGQMLKTTETVIRASPSSHRGRRKGRQTRRENAHCAGDVTRPDCSFNLGFGTRVVLTAFVFMRGLGTGIAMAAASGSSSSGAAW